MEDSAVFCHGDLGSSWRKSQPASRVFLLYPLLTNSLAPSTTSAGGTPSLVKRVDSASGASPFVLSGCARHQPQSAAKMWAYLFFRLDTTLDSSKSPKSGWFNRFRRTCRSLVLVRRTREGWSWDLPPLCSVAAIVLAAASIPMPQFLARVAASIDFFRDVLVAEMLTLSLSCRANDPSFKLSSISYRTAASWEVVSAITRALLMETCEETGWMNRGVAPVACP